MPAGSVRSQRVSSAVVRVTVAAMRETFEGTGYPCELLSIDLITHALVAGAQTADTANGRGRE